jgi:hypothetical protein
LLVNLLAELFALAQGISRDACALHVAPHQLIRVEVRCIAGQKVQGQFAISTGNVCPSRRPFCVRAVRRLSDEQVSSD